MENPDISTILLTPPELLSVDQYQSLARHTDRTAKSGSTGLEFPLLGLFGEVGSLMSELKKKQRDADSYLGYEPSVIEELGDVLWYFANSASRSNINLSEIALGLILAQKPVSVSDCKANLTFTDLQPTLTKTGPKPPQAFELILMQLAGEVGKLTAAFSAKSLQNNSNALTEHIRLIFRSLIAAATEADVSLADAAHNNLRKIFDRWPLEKIYPPLFDEEFDTDEQLPRIIEMEIFERTVAGKTYVFQRCNGIFIGDRLTDNKLEEDDYRFHDVFHLAYAAILGWSPVMRRLFKVKRKSIPKIDDAEDGARAALIEEGVSTWIFNHAAHLKYFKTIESVDYGLLKAVHKLVTGYEAEHSPLWLWEDAILDGYKVFRQICERRRGLVIADLNKRSITFKEI